MAVIHLVFHVLWSSRHIVNMGFSPVVRFGVIAACLRCACSVPTPGLIYSPNVRPATRPLGTPVTLPILARANTSCTNSPASRKCWGGGYDINTDLELSWPVTGNTRTVCYACLNVSSRSTNCMPVYTGDYKHHHGTRRKRKTSSRHQRTIPWTDDRGWYV